MQLHNIDVLIVNCNTDVLTNIAVSSIFKQLNSVDFTLTVFDNSYSGRFILSEYNQKYKDRIRILDNTQQQIIDFMTEYNKTRHKNLGAESFENCNQGSFKHSMSIQRFIDNYSADNLLLFDSDVILKRDVDFLDDSYLTVSDIELNIMKEKPGDFQIRFRPFIQYFNVSEMRRRKLQYFEPSLDPDYGRDEKYRSLQFDTGTAFFMKCLKQKNSVVRNINSGDYIFHMFAGTRRTHEKNMDDWKKLATDFI